MTWPEESAFTIRAGVKWQHGAQAMRQGNVLQTDTIVVRCRDQYSNLTERCRLVRDGQLYQIAAFNRNRVDQTIEITATRIDG